MTRVLVLDGSQRKSLAAVRSLAATGHDVFVADSRRLSLAGSSRFSSRTVRLPPPEGPNYLESLASLTERDSIDVVLPTDDQSMGALAGRRVIGRAALLTPSKEGFAMARDKRATVELAVRVGIDVPRTESPTSEVAARTIIGSFPLPAVIKPREGSGARGIVYAEDRDALRAGYAAVHARYPNPLVQEWVRPATGKTHVAMLTLDGRVLACFAQRVIREWPVRGGVGTLWQSMKDDAAIEATRELLQAARFTGVTLTEYLYADARGPVLMEVNPRFWNTLVLAIACGIDFPSLAVAAALGRPVEGPRDWPVDELAQWLGPGDILNFVFNPQRFSQSIGYLPFGRRTHAIWRSDDPMPMVAMLLIIARGSLSPRMWRYAFRR